MRAHTVPLVGLVLLVGPLAVACGSDDDGSSGGSSTSGAADTTVATTSVGTAAGTHAVEIVAVHEDFEYYGACGNETVDVDGTTFYPVLAADRDDIDEAEYPLEPGTTETSTAAGFARVAPPGPGDDVGTMVVYSDGMARFESDSGRVIWLTDQEQILDWVC